MTFNTKEFECVIYILLLILWWSSFNNDFTHIQFLYILKVF